MKSLSLGIVVVAACIFSGQVVQAQYKGPRDYFPKRNPAPPAGSSQATAPKPAEKQAPTKSQQPKFKDLPTNGQFYFLSDTNRTYVWTKVSASTAKNTKNGVTRSVSAETPIQK